MLDYIRCVLRVKVGQRGAAMTEYAIILAFVAAIAGLVFFENKQAGEVVGSGGRGLQGAIQHGINNLLEFIGKLTGNGNSFRVG